MTNWEDFYNTHLPPADFEDNRSLLKEFCERHNKLQNRIVLVTVSITLCFQNLCLIFCFFYYFHVQSVHLSF